jgi:hypothetical protein
VTSLLQLENIENHNQIQTVLNRYHNKTNDEEDVDVEDNVLEMENDLYELLTKLEDLEEHGENGLKLEQMSCNDLSKLIPASLRNKFQQDLRDGKIQHLVLHEWYPWWRRELVALNDNHGDNDSDRNDEDFFREQSLPLNGKTLDERLLEVPKFQTVVSKKSVESHQPSLLFYNLMDILYATCFTLRLYHGAINASRNEPTEAALTLIATSSVLSKDARYISVSEVLVSCTRSSAEYCVTNEKKPLSPDDNFANINIGANDWTVIVKDLAILVTSHRLVGRALLEASDVFKSAIKELKRGNDDNNNIVQEQKVVLKNIRRLRKKIEFFLSWTLYPDTRTFLSNDGQLLKDEILAWRDDWKARGMDDNYIDDKMSETLGLRSVYPPSNAKDRNGNRNPVRDEALVTEVASRKK